MAENNIRSFRYSDEVAAALEAQPGSSLNDKFEILVLYCSLDLERKKQQHAMYDRLIVEARDKLHAYDSMVEAMEKVQAQLRLLEAQTETLSRMEAVPQTVECLQEKCVTPESTETRPGPASVDLPHKCRTCCFYDPELTECENADSPMWLDMVDTDMSCYRWAES